MENYQNIYINNLYNNKNFAQFQIHQGINNKETIDRKKIAAAAFVGAITPVIILNACKKGRLDNLVNSFKNKLPFADKFKAIWNMLEIENFTQILATTVGGISGGLIAGLKQTKNKEDKEAKLKEATFEFLNNMIPTTLVALGTYASNKTGKFKSVPAKALMILTSVVGGMFIANKTSNKINEKVFDKDKEEKDIRHFKPTDCLVHIDDLVSLAVLTKIPLASTLQVDKLLPIIYARSGYEAGAAEKKKEQIKE